MSIFFPVVATRRALARTPGLVAALAALLVGPGGVAGQESLPTLSISSPSVTEGAADSTATLTFQVTLSAASSRSVTVAYGDARTGTATVTRDYAAFSTAILRFAAGDTVKSFDVTVKGDSLHEPSETVVATLSSPTNATIAAGTGTGTITDDDAAPTATLILSPSTVREGVLWATVRAQLDGRSAATTTITVSAAAGANADSTDFELSSNRTLTIAAEQIASRGNVRITALDNGVDEPNKQVTVSGAVSNSIGGFSNPADATLTIQDDEATPKVKLVLSRSTIDESGANNSATVTATMSPPSVQSTTITVAVAAGAGADSTDFTLSANKTLTIAAGDTASTGVVSVTAVDNNLNEPNKSLTVSATAANTQGATNPDAVALTIADEDGQPSLSISSPSVAEGAADSTATLTFQVKLSAPSEHRVTVKISDARTGTATLAQDYEVFSDRILTFAAGDTLASFGVTVRGDDLDEPNETVVAQLSQATNATIATGTGTGTITDDDAAPTVTLTVGRGSIWEGAPGITWTTVRAGLSAASSAATTVTVSAAAGTNADSTDFALSANKTLTIAAGQTASTEDVRINAVDNAVDDPNRQVTLSGAVSNSIGGYSNPADVTVTIQDDEATPKVKLVLSRTSIAESGATNSTTVTATMSPPSVQSTTITVAVAAGAGADSTDFTLSANKTLTIAAGDTASTGVVSVTAVDNNLNEPNKSLTVSATAANTQGATNPDAVALTIADDDGQPSLSISSPSVAEGAAGTTAALTFQVKLSAPSGQRVTVKVADARTGTATRAADYSIFSDAVLRFVAGDTVKSFDVTVVGDDLDEPNETVVAQLSQATNATIATGTGTGTITDDDAAPTVTLTVGRGSIWEGAPGITWTTVRAGLSAASSAATTVTVSAAAGTNADSTDFALSANKTLTIAAGQTASTEDVRINAVDNAVDDPNRQVTLSGAVSNSIGGYSNPADVTVTIQDDEATPKVKLVLSRSTVAESGATNSTTVTATMSPPSVQSTTITVAVAAGADADSSDFTVSANKTLTIAAGDTTSTGVVSVTAVDNDLNEPNKSLTVSATAANTQGATNPDAVALTIADDDGQPSLSISSPSVAEGAADSTATLRFQVRLSAPSGQRVTVKVADAQTGTATRAADYSIFSDAVLRFVAGDTLKSFDVTVRGDDLDEPNETVVAQLSQATNATIATATGTGTITDDDAAPTVTLTVGRGSIWEGAPGITWTTVRAGLSAASSAATTVTVSAAAGTNADSTDFALSANKTLTIAAGQTASTEDVRINAVDNAVDDPNRQVTLSGAVSNSIGGYSNPADVTVTIQDDEATPKVKLVLSRSTIDESGASNSAVVTATMSPPSVQSTTITVAVAAGAGADSTDFTLSANKTLTIAAGDTASTGVVSVTAVDNNLNEPNKSLTVSATAANTQGATNPDAVALTIADDDGQPSLSISSPSVAEGAADSTATLRFQVRLSAPSGQRVTVKVADAQTGTATRAADYSIFSDAVLRFVAGDTLKSFDVTVRGDDLDEPNETVVAQLSQATNATIATGTGTGTITDDDAAPTVTLTVGRGSIWEGAPGITWTTVRAGLSAASSAATTVTVSAAAGTNADSTDFALSANKTLTIAAGQTASTEDVRINAVDNAVDDPNRQVTLSGAVSNSIGGYSNPADVTVTIQDDEATPRVKLVLSRSTIAESGATNSAVVTATMSPASVQSTTITVSVVAGADADSSDFTVSANKTLTIAAGDTTSTGVVSVTAVDNDLNEPNKSLTVSATAANTQGATNPDAVALTIADEDGQPSLSISSPSVAEGAADSTATLTFQVRLSAPSGQRVTVKIADAQTGTATRAADYSIFADAVLRFVAGDTLKSFDVTVVGDDLDEPNETVVAQLSQATNATIATGTGTGTITDDDAAPTVTLTVGRGSIWEGAPGITWTTVRAGLSAASSAATTVTVSAAAGTNADSTDFALSANKTLTIAAGQTASTEDVRINAVDNAVDDPNRQVTLSGAVSNSIGGYSNPADVTVTIQDDEATPKVKLVLSRTSIAESGATNSTTVTATMSPPSVQETTITVAVAAGADADSTDFTVSANKTLTIAAGDTTSTGVVSVTAVDNDLNEPNKSLTVSATAANTQGATNPDAVALTIADDDGQPSLSISSPSVAEGAADSTATLRFQVRLSAPSGQRVTVKVADAQTGTATRAADYSIFSDAVLRFTAGDTLKSFDVTVRGDTLDEPNETVVVQLSQATNATIATGTGTGTITDDDAAPTVTLTVGRGSIWEGAPGITWTTVRAGLSAASSAATTVTVSAAAGTNADSTDFALSANKTLTIAAGQTASTEDVRINAVDNAVDDPNRQVTLSGAVSNSIGGYSNPADVTVTIQDDEATPKVKLVLSRSTIAESGATNSTTVTATMSPASVQSTTITVSVVAGADADSSDFTVSANKTLTIAAGDTTSTGVVSVTAVDNDLNEPNKSLTVSATAANTQGATNPDAVALTIADDDGQPSLSISSPSVAEGAADSTATLRFQVRLSAPSGQRVTVKVADAQTGTATRAADYSIFSDAVLRFVAGDTLKSFDVTVRGDDLDEPNETVVAQLSQATNATIATGTGTGTITDDDAAPTVTLWLGRSTIREGGTGFTHTTVRADLSERSGAATTVTVSAAPGTNADSTDFTLSANKTLTIAAGDTASTGTVELRAVDDAVDGPNKQVTVSGAVSNSIGGYSNPADVTVTIQDDEATPKVKLVLSRTSIAESGASNSAVVTATMSPPSVQSTTITVAVAAGANADSTDFTASANKTLTIAAGDTTSTGVVSVTAVDNDLNEPNKSLTVSATAANTQGATNPDAVALTIADDDGQPSLSISSPSVAEGAADSTATLTFRVRLSAPSGQRVTVRIADARTGTATFSTDYATFSDATLSFAAGDTVTTFDVTVNGDDLDEPNETVVAQLSQATNATIATSTGTGAITDDDAAPTVTLWLGRSTIREGGTGFTHTTVRADLSERSGAATTVTVSAAPGTNADSTDFTLSANKTLTIAAGDTASTGTVELRAVDDAVDGPNKQVTVSGAVSNSIGGYSNPADVTVTIQDDEATPKVKLVLSRTSIAESGASNSAAVTATMSPPSVQETTITVAVAAGAGADSSDFTVSANKTLTIAAGDTTNTGVVSVTAVDNNLDEPNKALTVSATATNTQGVTNPDNLTLTIADDDGTSSSMLSARSARVAEGGSGATAVLRFMVRLLPASTARVAVNYADAGTGTATPGVDYEALAGGTLTFEAGDTLATISVTVLGDEVQEGDETVVLTLSGATNAQLAAPTITGTIVDDDALPPPSLHVDSPKMREGDDGFATMPYTVTLLPASAEEVRVDYADARAGTATSGTDYTLQPGTLVFQPGDTVRTIPVQVAGDNAKEPDETVVIVLSNARGARLATVYATGTILDDEVTFIAVDAPRAEEGDARHGSNDDAPATLVFTVSMAPAGYQEVSVAYADAGTGTATPGVDYEMPSPDTLSFAPGETRKTVEVTLIGDDLDESDETVVLQLSRPTNAEIEGNGRGTGTIVDDDGAPTLSIDSPTAAEGGPGETAALRFAVRLNAPTTKQVAVNYADAGTGTATPGADYQAVAPGTLVFAPGDTVKAVEATVHGDALDEPAETIVLALTNPVHAELAQDGATGVATIADDDDPPFLSIDSPTVQEGGPGESAVVSFTVSLGAPSAKRVKVEYADAGTGTATPDADYQAVAPGTLVFAPGDTVKAVEATVHGDALDEPAETIVLALTNPVHAELAQDGATGVATIADDDDAPSLSVDSPTVAEGNDGRRPLTFSFTLDRPSGRRVVMKYADAGTGTATPGADYEEVPPGVLSFEPGETLKTLDVMVLGDARHEPDETVVLRLSTPDPAVATLTTEEGVGAIGNDDANLIPTFGDALVPPQRWMEGRGIDPLRLPPAQGGDGPLSYALAPALPPGLVFDPESRTIAGTPGAGQPVTAYRYAATDQDGDSATLSFTIEVVAAEQTARRLDEVNRALLPEVARTWADVASNAVAGRVAQAGHAGTGAGAWGHGEHRELSGARGQGSPVDWSGEVAVLGAGADVGLGAAVTLGVAVTRLESVFDYAHQAEGRAVGGRHDTRLTGVHPYLGWSGAGGSHAWTTVGWATSDVVVRDDEIGPQTTAGRAQMLAAGASVRLFAGSGGGTVNAKGDGHVARFQLDGAGDRLSALEVGVHRLRFAFEAGRSFRLGGNGALKPSVALGVRHDGGDGRIGAGLEAGGGLTLSAWNSRLQVEAAGRTLLAHGGGLTEWGAGGSLRVAPGADGRGLSLSVAPEWGVPASGIGQLWQQGVAQRPGFGHPQPPGATPAAVSGPAQPQHAVPGSRLRTEMAYGLGATVAGTEALVTPFAAFGPDLGVGGTAWRFGARLRTPTAVGLAVGLEAAYPGSGLRLDLELNR